MINSIYQSLIDLLNTAVFGGGMTETLYGSLWVEGIAVVACSLLLALPFWLVYRIIKRFI